jgi:hypothetical protein
VKGSVDEMAELREDAAAQAAVFNIGVEETETTEESMPGGWTHARWLDRRVTRDCKSAGAPNPWQRI